FVAVLWYSVSRCAEILWAFSRDAFDHLENKRLTSGLNNPDRLRLLGISYGEAIIDFGLIHYCLMFLFGQMLYKPVFANVFEAIYFSAITITTVGYGDITPQCFLSRLASVSEVLAGFVLIVLAVGVYLSSGSRDSEP